MPILMSVLAAVFFVIALKANMSDGWRLLFVLLGVVCSIWAAVTGLDWVVWRSGAHLQRIREAAYGPQLEMARIVSLLNSKQLDLLQEGGYLSIYPARQLVDGRAHWMVKLPEIDVPYAWICEYLESCKNDFPLMPIQHGLPDNTERARRRAFAKLVTSPEWDLAEWSVGNRACMWKLPTLSAVYDALGMSE